MASAEEPEIHATILEKSGIDTRGIEIRTVRDQLKALRTDIQRIESYPLLAKGITTMGAIYDVKTGLLNPIEP
jgi:carbonic anhydrase